jgi:hypothetical protein
VWKDLNSPLQRSSTTHLNPAPEEVPSFGDNQSWQSCRERRRVPSLRCQSRGMVRPLLTQCSSTFSTKVCMGTENDDRTVTTTCLNPATENGLQRPTDLSGKVRAQLIMARSARPQQKGRIHLRRLLCGPIFPLAVVRRTIHFVQVPTSGLPGIRDVTRSLHPRGWPFL